MVKAGVAPRGFTDGEKESLYLFFGVSVFEAVAGADLRGAIITAQKNEGLSHIFWWAASFSLMALGAAVLSIVEPGWIQMAVGSRDTLAGAEWLMAAAHFVVAIFLGGVARTEWRATYPRTRSTGYTTDKHQRSGVTNITQ